VPEAHACDWARLVARLQPALYAVAVVGVPGGEDDWVSLQWSEEMRRGVRKWLVQTVGSVGGGLPLRRSGGADGCSLLGSADACMHTGTAVGDPPSVP
jgi:hypothetical protein